MLIDITIVHLRYNEIDKIEIRLGSILSHIEKKKLSGGNVRDDYFKYIEGLTEPVIKTEIQTYRIYQ
jgi:hypothetical protein